ncbi:uncharacterized protein [Polyergus mexicanus]|uniref:uncharacterized protein n=1 Tax=Polyergus mexicanus TaxID=615972 RepID=UPI0038B422D2
MLLSYDAWYQRRVLNAQAQHKPQKKTDEAADDFREILREMREEIRREIRSMHAEIYDLKIRGPQPRQNNGHRTPPGERTETVYEFTPEDVRHQRGRGFLQLKEARGMIPEFDGSPNKLQEFLSATTYAVEHIDPLDEVTLLGAVLYTKLKGRAMLDFQTRKIRDFAQLKNELEVCYASKKSTTHLQIEFNTLKQKNGESARTYGLRTDKLAMELYESMMEGRHHTVDNKRAIMEIIQQQALENFQIGLQDEIKTIVRSRGYATLQEAIAAASAEEKVKGPPATGTRSKINFTPTYKQENKINVQCQKCGKIGHYGRDCRTSRYTNRFSLPKPDRQPRVNTVNKYCHYCKKSGHDREECWLLHGRPNRDQSSRIKQYNSRPENKNRKNSEQGKKKFNSTQNSDEEERNERKSHRPAMEYQVSHFKNTPHIQTGLDLVTLPMREAKREKINLLFDAGAAISLIKVKHLKGETLIEEEKITLTGVTGHKICTLGKFKATITLRERRINHTMYVIKDDFPIEYDGILGVDFLRKHQATCNYKTKQLKVGQHILKLYSYLKMTLKPRSETIIQVATDKNTIGVIKAEETIPGIFIGNCLIEPTNYLCAVSIINTTDNTIEMLMPQVNIEEIKRGETEEINIIRTLNKEEVIPRSEKILRLLHTQHLNKEEKKTIMEICQDFSDVMHIEGEPLTCTDTVAHKIATQADSSPVNVRPYRLPEKHKEEVNQPLIAIDVDSRTYFTPDETDRNNVQKRRNAKNRNKRKRTNHIKRKM